MKLTTLIYCLTEPGTLEIRYIGKTDGTLKDRLRRHLLNYGERDHRANWIEKLKRAGKVPDIHLLSIVPREDFVRFERAFISVARQHGLRLTNLTDGGDGMSGHVPSAATCAKLSAVWKGRKHRPETRLKQSLAAKGKSKSPAHCKNMSIANKGKVIPPETRLKISASTSGEKNHNFGKPLHPNTVSSLRNKRPGSSKFKGVHLHACGMWHTQFSVGYKKHYVGLFRKEIDAAVAYDTALELMLGKSAKLNFSYDPACYI